jgi:hypothetical protein
MTLQDSRIVHLLFSDTAVAEMPFMHSLVEESKRRQLDHARKPGCPVCKGPVYIEDLQAKAINLLCHLSDENKVKLKNFLRAQEDIFLSMKTNGKNKTIQIA